MLMKLLTLGLAGGLGACSRYGLHVAMERTLGSDFPWGTFTVNVLGCLAFGLIYALFEKRGVRPELALFVLTGFMGAFTTFSTYWFETNQLLESGRYGVAALNFLGQNVLGFIGMAAGLFLGRSL